MENYTMKHEQELANIFRTYMVSQSIDKGYKFHTFSLGGQDRDAGADYLLTDSDRFTLIEFKYSDKDLISENKKTRRLTLCQKLPTRPDMESLHDKCHFITYSDSVNGFIQTNIYRKQICNTSIFGKNSGLKNQHPDISTRCDADSFSNGFFNNQSTNSLSLDEFETYLSWLLTEASGSDKTTLELLVKNPDSKELGIKRLGSIREAQQWVQDNSFKPQRPQWPF